MTTKTREQPMTVTEASFAVRLTPEVIRGMIRRGAVPAQKLRGKHGAYLIYAEGMQVLRQYSEAS